LPQQPVRPASEFGAAAEVSELTRRLVEASTAAEAVEIIDQVLGDEGVLVRVEGFLHNAAYWAREHAPGEGAWRYFALACDQVEELRLDAAPGPDAVRDSAAGGVATRQRAAKTVNGSRGRSTASTTATTAAQPVGTEGARRSRSR